MSTGQNYRGYGVSQSGGTPCGAGFQPAQSPHRERLDIYFRRDKPTGSHLRPRSNL